MITDEAQKFIVILGTVDILNVYIHTFLSQVQGWEIITLPGLAELDDFIRRNTPANLDTFIIVHNEKQHSLCDIQVHLLQEQPQLKMVVINPEDNAVEIYCKQKTLLNDVSDLVSIIRTEDIIHKEEVTIDNIERPIFNHHS